MKTENQLQNVLSVKEKQLVETQNKLAELDTWIRANNAFGVINEVSFLERLLTEKIDVRTRQIQLEEQIKIIQWVLQ